MANGRVRNYGQFVNEVRAAATTENDVFAARIMWGSLGRIIEGLQKPSGQSDLVALEAAFGPLAFVFLRRDDVVAQAVSWCRAEQTGFWHVGDSVMSSPRQDVAQMKQLVSVIDEHNTAWRSWFDRHEVRPHEVTYENLVREPRASVEGIADRVRVILPAAWRPASPHGKQSDELNHRWAAALRTANERE